MTIDPDKIRKKLVNSKLPYRTLAKRGKVSVATIFKIKNGHDCRLSTLKKLQKALRL